MPPVTSRVPTSMPTADSPPACSRAGSISPSSWARRRPADDATPTADIHTDNSRGRPNVVAQQRMDLEEFFHPKAVAIVGSVNRNADPERLRKTHAERWGDRWFLVNAKGGHIGDIPVYEHVTDIPSEITLAVINVGTRLVTKVVEACGKHGVTYVLVFTAGLSDVGEAGAAREREVGEVA